MLTKKRGCSIIDSEYANSDVRGLTVTHNKIIVILNPLCGQTAV